MNMGCGLGAYYNGEIDLYLTGPYLFLYPIYDMPVAFFEGIGGRPYHWKAAVDVGYSYTVDGIPLTLNLYARPCCSGRTTGWEHASILGWEWASISRANDMKRYCALLLFLLWLCPGTMQGQAAPTPLQRSHPPFPPEEETPGTAAPVAAPKSGRDFPTFAISYYAPSWFSIASGKGNCSASLEETSPKESLLIPLEFRIAVWQWNHLSLVSSVVPALYAENHLPSSLNLSVGAGIFYNTFFGGASTESPPYLVLILCSIPSMIFQ